VKSQARAEVPAATVRPQIQAIVKPIGHLTSSPGGFKAPVSAVSAPSGFNNNKARIPQPFFKQ
jgi:hypothetical protein